MSSSSKSQSLDFLSENHRVRALIEKVEQGIYSLDVKKHMDEIDNLHSMRKTRRVSYKDLGETGVQKNLVEASLENQAFRSRLVEIQMTAFRKRTMLENKVEGLKAYLSSKYAGKLREALSTVGDRAAAISNALDPALNLLTTLDNLHQYAQLVIDDVDKAAWSLSSVERLFTQATQRERTM